MPEPIPGDRPPVRPAGGPDPTGQPTLARPPSERYRRPTAPPPSRRAVVGRSLAVSLAVAAAGSGAFMVLAGLLAVDVGLLAVAVLVGYLVGLAIRGSAAVLDRTWRIALAVAVIVLALLVGDAGTWLIARSQGGVLPFLDHLSTVYGWQVPVTYGLGIVAATFGAW